jgi:DNA adenine methylase
MPRGGARLVEPFAGSAAITLAAAARNAFERFLIADGLAPLAEIWRLVIHDPQALARGYERLWRRQLNDARQAYETIRAEFNASRDPIRLLYLLARCVKGSARFNREGEFNQAPDNRRLGTRPDVMRREIFGAHALLNRRSEARAADFRETLAEVRADDVVYMDPPYQGISGGRDRRYFQGVALHDLVTELNRLNVRGVPFLLSYDGTCGDRAYGAELPKELDLVRVPLRAGRSTQSTLAGRAEITVESLYVSPAARIACAHFQPVVRPVRQVSLRSLRLSQCSHDHDLARLHGPHKSMNSWGRDSGS